MNRRRTRGPLCPACGKPFKNESRLLQHLNQPWGRCSAQRQQLETLAPHHNSETYPETNDDNPTLEESTFDDAGVLYDDANEADPASEKHQYFYPDAGKTYGHAPSFIDIFNTDQHAKERLTNTYWPFSSKADWGMGSWLLRSGLSMRAINDFLGLEKV